MGETAEVFKVDQVFAGIAIYKNSPEPPGELSKPKYHLTINEKLKTN